MKAGITLAFLLGAVSAIAGTAAKVMHWPGANGMLIAGLFLCVSAFVFWMLHNAREGQHD